MNFTIFGYPKTGKTSLFNLLTGAGIEVNAYGSGKKEPNLRTCSVPDSRLDKLSSFYPDKIKKSTMVDYTDLAGASFGEVKNETYLNYLRKADGLTNVVRGFKDENISHPKGRIAPEEDISAMEQEMILADLLSLESRLEKIELELKRMKNPEGEKEREFLLHLHQELENSKALREVEMTPREEKMIRSFAFLSKKPLIHIINVDEDEIHLIKNPQKFYPHKKAGTAVMAFCGKIEMEILELDEEEKQVFLAEYGLDELSSSRFLKASYDILDVITFFSIGNEEVKAWPIRNGLSAIDAAGTIHSDIAKGFIRAEVISCDQLFVHQSFQAARDNGAVRLEGKDYIVRDGDVVYFRFSK